VAKNADPLSGGVLVEAVAEVREDMGWDATLDEVAEEPGERSRDGNEDPEERREDETGYGDGFKRDSNKVCLMKADVEGADMRDDFDAADDDGCEQEGDDGERADADEKDIDGTGYALATTAVSALSEVLIVVGAHGGGESGDVIAPSGEDVPYHRVGAGAGTTIR
jgi:hypothetical protein